ncbi:hypothetical protein KIPB_006113, partial [Kipferlia bialata]|eukprot:g6113.t1
MEGQETGERERETMFEALCLRCENRWLVKALRQCQEGGGTELDASNIVDRTGFVPTVVEALALFPNLLKLHLSSKVMFMESLGDDGATAVAQALHLVPGLEELDLSHNKITATGASSLAQALTSVPNLKKLDLTLNSFGDEGVTAVAQALHLVPKLEEIGLNNREITATGASSLAQALTSVP